jgi:hypothetical protein
MFSKIVLTAAMAATNLLSSSPIIYEAPPQPVVRVVSNPVEVPIDKTLEAIIKCESQGNPNAFNVNRNKSTDHGLLQVNSVHKPRMADMGLNIENPDHSLAFGIMLYQEQGTKPWRSSEKCWSSMVK